MRIKRLGRYRDTKDLKSSSLVIAFSTRDVRSGVSSMTLYVAASLEEVGEKFRSYSGMGGMRSRLTSD